MGGRKKTVLGTRGRLLGCAASLLVALLVLAGIFWIGMRIGETRARFFGGSPALGYQLARPPWGQDFVKSHGALGEILSIDPNGVVLKSRGSIQRRILVAQDTIIAREHQRLDLSDLQIGERIIAIGSVRENGDLDARVIRVWIRGFSPRETPEVDK